MDVNLLDFTTKFFLNNSPKDFSVTDTTNYAGTAVSTPTLIQPAIAFSQVDGIVTATLPSNTIFHAGSFSSPDIDRNVSDTLSGIVIPTNVDGELSKGVYKYNYRIRVTDELFQLPILNIDTNSTSGNVQVHVSGNWLLVNDDGTQRSIINNSTPANNKVVTLAKITYDSTNDTTIFEINESLVVDISGEFQIKATREYSKDHEYDFQYNEVEANIAMSYDLNKSELTSDDQTDYGTYVSIVRTHTVMYPRDMLSPPADIVQPLKKILVNPIYTNNWTTTISTVLEALEDGLYIQDTIKGTENIDVNVDDTLAECYQCIVNVYNSFKEAEISKNQIGLRKWGGLSQKIGNEYDAYSIARSSGKNTEAQLHLDNIKTLVASTGCVPTTNSNNTSILVIAVSSGGVSTVYNEVVNGWYEGTSDPLAGQYSDSDWYLNKTSGEIFQKAAGVWVSIVSTIIGASGTDGTQILTGSGSPGAIGADGDFYIDSVTAFIWLKTAGVWNIYVDPNGADGVAMLYANKSLVTFNYSGAAIDIPGVAYTIPANELEVGDTLEVTLVVKAADSNQPGGIIYLTLGTWSNIVGEYVAGTDTIKFKARITLKTVTQFMATVDYWLSNSQIIGSPQIVPRQIVGGVADVQSEVLVTPGFDFSSTVIVKAQFENPNPAFDIHVTEFSVLKLVQK